MLNKINKNDKLVTKMLLKHFFTFFCILGTILSMSLLDGHDQSMSEGELSLIINMENKKTLPRNFRMTESFIVLPDEIYEILPIHSELNTEGLFELHASASGQFSQKSLSKILEIVPASQLLLIDLREESHGFVNGIAVSWYGEKDWGNKDKSLDEIQSDEKERLQRALNDQYIYIYEKNALINEPLLVQVTEAYSEEDLAQKMGIPYIRIPITDHLKPSSRDVDFFVELIKTRILSNPNPDLWIHLHCSAGRGRATTFIAMYDMMRNAAHVSFDDILSRQAMIGGKDLSVPFDISDWRYYHHFERLQFLEDFYNYCIKNPNFEKSWSSWVSK